MRYTAVQEQECGMTLPQNQLPDRTNDGVMADVNTVTSKTNNASEEGSVVSNLPLLFANGHPTSLEKITLAQLERFITFMVQCSLGHDTTDVITEPRWWPKDVKFSNPIARPKRVNDNWMANLKKLVFRCYTYHRSEYLLRFCSYLARYPKEDLEYINNWDSTTSLYHRSTGKLLVTFRNENMNYDQKHQSPRKKLLTCNKVSSCSPVKPKQQQHSIVMVEPPTEDIYLCDNCDAELVGLEKMKEHERICCEQEQTGSNSRPTTPEVSITKPELKQDQFLEYFKLCTVKSGSEGTLGTDSDSIDNDKSLTNADTTTAKPATITTNNNNNNNSTIKKTTGRVRGTIRFTRCHAIPFSSPAGILLAKKSKAMTEEIQQERLDRIERHLVAPVLNSTSRPKWLEMQANNDKWTVTYKPNREKLKWDYVHQYKFVNSVKRKPMLSIQSQLLYVVCRPVCVLLTRLAPRRANGLEQALPKYRCLVRNASLSDKATETRENAPSKRKAPSDETESNETKRNEKDDESLYDMEKMAFRHSIESPDAESIEKSTVNRTTSNAVVMIDLCSSDDEGKSFAPRSTDENRNPTNRMAEDVEAQSLFQNVSSTEIRLKSRICSAEQRDDWLSDNILHDNRENCTNNCHSGMLSAQANISPIFGPAP